MAVLHETLRAHKFARSLSSPKFQMELLYADNESKLRRLD